MGQSPIEIECEIDELRLATFSACQDKIFYKNKKNFVKVVPTYLMLFFGCKSCNCVIWRGCKYKKLWYNLIKLRKKL